MPRDHHHLTLVLSHPTEIAELALVLHRALGPFAAATGCRHDGLVLCAEVSAAHDPRDGLGDPDEAVEDVLDGLRCSALSDPRIEHALVLSGDERPVDVPYEDDLERFRRTRTALGHLGVDLTDWVTTDGRDVRSLRATDGSLWG